MCKFTNDFYWYDFNDQNNENLTAAEKYQSLVGWAGKARGQNPNMFDALTEWILDDKQWSQDNLAENEKILMQYVIARFKGQNARLREHLKALKPSGVVNQAVFEMLDRFDDELCGKPLDKRLEETVSKMFADFNVMKERNVREQIAGNKTGAYGTDSVKIFGFINYLKNDDASVQWALFMPQVVENQQNGFKVESFEYKKMPAMRFIGKESNDHGNKEFRKEIFYRLDNLSDYKTELGYDVYFIHHYGLGVDVDDGHGFWGRFMKADTPVPEGFVFFDFISQRVVDDFVAGPPYLSQFAYAVFKGDTDAIHKDEGYDGNAMYDVTRNIILGQGVNIPYPDKYWTAEVFLNGVENESTAYMFSAEF